MIIERHGHAAFLAGFLQEPHEIFLDWESSRLGGAGCCSCELWRLHFICLYRRGGGGQCEHNPFPQLPVPQLELPACVRPRSVPSSPPPPHSPVPFCPLGVKFTPPHPCLACT